MQVWGQAQVGTELVAGLVQEWVRGLVRGQEQPGQSRALRERQQQLADSLQTSSLLWLPSSLLHLRRHY